MILSKYFPNKPMMLNTNAISLMPKTQGTQAFGGSSIIPIHGVLTKRSSVFDEFFGATSYAEIYENISAALANPDVEQVILDIDSPGGEVSGLFDLCGFIRQAKKEKTIVAYANDDCFSAAYAIAASCSKITINCTSGVGSIGVIATHLDVSEFHKKEGLKYTTIFKGARKNDLNSHEPIADETLQGLDLELSRLYEMFVELVAKGRYISIDAIKSTEAGVFYGDDAIKAGLADEITNSFDVMNFNLNSFNNNTFQMEKFMEIEEKIVEIDTEQIAEEIAEKPKPADETQVFEDLPKADEPNTQGYKSEISEIAKLCKLAKMPEKLAEFIESGTSINDARDSLMKALASKTEDIRSTISTNVKPAESPVVTAAKERVKSNF